MIKLNLSLKLIALFIAVAGVIIYTSLSFYACEKKEPVVSLPPDEIVQKVISDLGLSDDFGGTAYTSDAESQKLSEETLNELYADKGGEKIDLTRIEKYSLLLGSANSANEIGIFRVYDKSASVSYVEDIVKNRLRTVQVKFEDYISEQPDALNQLTAANSGEVRTYGNYIYYVIHPIKDKIFEKIENIYKGVNS